LTKKAAVSKDYAIHNPGCSSFNDVGDPREHNDSPESIYPEIDEDILLEMMGSFS
ncbi:hypothetical protein TNCV_1836071, partial [Trichonephila clavipes]